MSDAKIKAAYVAHFGKEDGWLGEPGSWFTEGYRSAVTEVGRWQPIETAPPGRKVLAGYWNKLGNWRTITARYFPADTLDSEHTESGFADEGWYEESETYEEILPTDCEPTHWQPLPAAPDMNNGEEGK